MSHDIRSGGDVQTKTAAYTAVATDRLVLCDASGGAFTVTLPAANASGALSVKKTDSTANAVTVARAGADTLDGGTTFDLTAQNHAAMLMSDGSSAWVIVGRRT